MYLTIRIALCIAGLCLLFDYAQAQNEPLNNNAVEWGLNFAGDETLFYGGNSKFIMPLSQRKHYPTFSISLTMYFDFKGESEPLAYLKKSVDMRIIPAIHLGYSFNFKRMQFNLEVPVGTSIAISKGTLINERAGFERDYSDTEMLWHYGVAFLPKYRLNDKNQIGLNVFYPLVPDKTWSGYLYGIGWTRTIID